MKLFKFDTLRRFLLRNLRDTWIKPLNPQHPHSVLISRATYSPWYNDPAFMKTYDTVKNSTLVDIYRCYELWTLVRQLEHVQGDAIEVGVWKGGTGALIASQLSNVASSRKMYLCDTFVGVVKAGEKDTLYRGGEHADTSKEAVLELMGKLGVSQQVEILQGIFPEESAHSIEHSQFAFCHIDVDTYLSAKDVFEWVSPRLSVHGVVVFDDYGTWGCEGVADLVQEIAKDSRFFLFQNINGHAVFIKLADSNHG
ncbi:MAG TPA: TylF/MycF/NovP-related O-methyltransferase [Pseudomonas sp.]|uniref:TylF/MycF/NovP-related O-methyltransferase n=1 Tax=Pseudomonas sp. TaxID=306 RepID=UPI002EDABBD5